MNEELQKELVAILRAMKDGTPEAFNVLVEQRSTYCMTIWLTCMLSAMVLFIAAAVAFAKSRHGPFFSDCGDPSVKFFAFIAAVIATVAACVTTGTGLSYLAEGIAPLGRVLEVLR